VAAAPFLLPRAPPEAPGANDQLALLMSTFSTHSG
jgi:hypothetical protein